MYYVNCLKLPIMKMHIKVGTFQSGKSIFLRLLLFKFNLKYGIKLFFISYKIYFFTIRFMTISILRMDAINVFLSEHCNENFFLGFAGLTSYEGKVDAEIHSRC